MLKLLFFHGELLESWLYKTYILEDEVNNIYSSINYDNIKFIAGKFATRCSDDCTTYILLVDKVQSNFCITLA